MYSTEEIRKTDLLCPKRWILQAEARNYIGLYNISYRFFNNALLRYKRKQQLQAAKKDHESYIKQEKKNKVKKKAKQRSIQKRC